MTMLTIKVDAHGGADLRNCMLAMLDLARRTGCQIELRGNGTVFWVRPNDHPTQIGEAFDRLYPSSEFVATWIERSIRRPKPQIEGGS